MTALSPEAILHIWEVGLDRGPVGRALTILAAAYPEEPIEALADASIGHRDGLLLRIREDTLGPMLHGRSGCPGCGNEVEFEVDLPHFRVGLEPGDTIASRELEVLGWNLKYRLPTSRDQLESLQAGDPESALRVLAGRCVLQASRGEVSSDARELEPEAIAGLAEAMIRDDPAAEMLLDFTCPECGSAGQTLLDISCYLWEEIRAEAIRLVGEVHGLATAYGWAESAILGMSPQRRRLYLELAT